MLIKSAKYSVKSNVTLKNKLNGETIKCDIINENDIDGKGFWVVLDYDRGNKILLSKESYTIVKR